MITKAYKREMKMIRDENEIDHQFYNNVMRMNSSEESKRLQEKIDDEVMLEIELSNLDLCEGDFDMGHSCVPETKAEAIITVKKRPSSDSRRPWTLDKLVVGARSSFSA